MSLPPGTRVQHKEIVEPLGADGMGEVRLLCQRGELARGREMLAGLYGWFTEGFDAPDVKEARSLLERLG